MSKNTKTHKLRKPNNPNFGSKIIWPWLAVWFFHDLFIYFDRVFFFQEKNRHIVCDILYFVAPKLPTHPREFFFYEKKIPKLPKVIHFVTPFTNKNQLPKISAL